MPTNSEGEGLNPVANFFLLMREREKKGEKNAQEKRIWKRNEKWRARERPLTRKRARNRGLDSKDLSGKKRLDSKDVKMWSKRP